jgi:hypothetical protein
MLLSYMECAFTIAGSGESESIPLLHSAALVVCDGEVLLVSLPAMYSHHVYKCLACMQHFDMHNPSLQLDQKNA